MYLIAFKHLGFTNLCGRHIRLLVLRFAPTFSKAFVAFADGFQFSQMARPQSYFYLARKWKEETWKNFATAENMRVVLQGEAGWSSEQVDELDGDRLKLAQACVQERLLKNPTKPTTAVAPDEEDMAGEELELIDDEEEGEESTMSESEEEIPKNKGKGKAPESSTCAEAEPTEPEVPVYRQKLRSQTTSKTVFDSILHSGQSETVTAPSDPRTGRLYDQVYLERKLWTLKRLAWEKYAQERQASSVEFDPVEDEWEEGPIIGTMPGDAEPSLSERTHGVALDYPGDPVFDEEVQLSVPDLLHKRTAARKEQPGVYHYGDGVRTEVWKAYGHALARLADAVRDVLDLGDEIHMGTAEGRETLLARAQGMVQSRFRLLSRS